MVISDEGIEFIIEREGEKLTAYLDSVGVWTIGVGHTKGVKRGQRITSAESRELFEADIAEFEEAVNDLVKIPLTQNEFDALVSFTFNLGKGALKKSTLLKKLNKGDKESAANEFLKWNKGRINGKLIAIKGLTIRRTLERKLFLGR